MKTFHHEYGDINPRSEYGYSPKKAAFHKHWKAVLRNVAKELGFTEFKAVSNPGGPAVMGAVSLQAPKHGVYVSVDGDLCGDLDIMFRAATLVDPYGARSMNYWIRGTDDPKEIAGTIRRAIELVGTTR